MPLIAVFGIYRDGRIELDEEPAGIQHSRVAVTFLSSATGPSEDDRADARQRAFDRMESGIFQREEFDRSEVYQKRLTTLDARRDFGTPE